MATPVLAVRGLSKRVRNRTIVKDVCFDVFPGQVFGFLGPNGAGKTTTIRMLVGLIRPTAGEVKIGGYNIRTHPLEAMRQVGCIVENPDLYPYLTGRENLLQLARMQGQSAVERIDEVAALVHLEDRLDEKVRTYSLGMRQRLGIAQALLGNPQLLILDEPTNGLDPAGIRELRSFLQNLAKTGLAVFISSHLLSEVELLCSHLAIIREGTVIKTGAIEELLSSASGDVIWRVEPVATAKAVLTEILRTPDDNPYHDFSRVTESATGQLSCPMTDELVATAVSRLLQQGCTVFEVTRRRVSLEDFFLQTTEQRDEHSNEHT
ncbi:ABC transporter ATP-binding protein [Alicyclobacillus mengziensis]|uniref:ABC transporter ATP-binding protein n=1 Tax=Alicyclobacillus mengziensis TaxID=2931921 RepID=A0A9X7W2B5_9BACL|nr:ABC transporter ATP-binding protein [Alicyclobacillus mengziensis]QSO48960.1 ABC transporter ATP-binding protein [Alicyclobacillus mengziensis]